MSKMKKMKKLTLAEGNKLLDDIVFLFQKNGMTSSAPEVTKIKNELNGTKNYVSLNLSFKVLQTSFIVDYNTSPHRILCSSFFQARVNRTLKTNTIGLNNIYLDFAWAQMIEYRNKSRMLLFTLDNVLKKGSKTNEDGCVSLSYLYLASIDGVYGKNLKDIVIFDKLANLQTVKSSTIISMKMKDIVTHFQTISGSDCLFDGWDEDVRNAIAHSSFWYDKKKKKMIFEERKKGITKEKTLDELLDMIVKLSDIDQLVFYYNQIFRVNRIIFDLK